MTHWSIEQKFCSQSCSAKWSFRQPEFRKKIFTEARAAKIQASREKTFAEHPEIYAAMIAKQAATMANYMNSLTPAEKAKRRKHQVATAKRLGFRFSVRGGNGTGPTAAEKQLLVWFPQGRLNFPIKTGKWNGSGFPPTYKADVAFPKLGLAIEADGGTHNSPLGQMRDAKKTAFLQGLGWTVLRFTNREILENGDVVRKLLSSIISRLQAIRPTA